jgi:hypothetical protein
MARYWLREISLPVCSAYSSFDVRVCQLVHSGGWLVQSRWLCRYVRMPCGTLCCKPPLKLGHHGGGELVRRNINEHVGSNCSPCDIFCEVYSSNPLGNQLTREICRDSPSECQD